MTESMLERDAALAEIVRRPVAAYQPERIYLFGSMARGDPDADSDYDLDGRRAGRRTARASG
jgi:predicted nucleotidyltransferase